MIYIDELIILNFIIDYILLEVLSKLIKEKPKIYRLLLSCLFGELSIIYLFINVNNLIIYITKIIICIIMILISYGKDNIIRNTIYYYILSFFLGGVLTFLKQENIIKYKYVLLLIPIIMNIYKKYEYSIKKILSTKYLVSIYLKDGRVLYLKGFLDSGNTLIEPYNHKKVIIINKEVNENYYLVPYQTISENSLIKCFNPKKVYIDGIGERNDICVGVIKKKFKGYDCLLNYKIMEE